MGLISVWIPPPTHNPGLEITLTKGAPCRPEKAKVLAGLSDSPVFCMGGRFMF